MNVIVAGTRIITDFDLVRFAIVQSGFVSATSQIIVGCADDDFAKGKINVDVLGWVYAKLNRIQVRCFPVSAQEWQTLGQKAGPLRNEKMGQVGEALVLVWDGESPGSASMLRIAERLCLERCIVRVKPWEKGKWSVESLQKSSGSKVQPSSPF